MIVYIPISTDEGLSFDVNSEPDVLIAALRLHKGFLIKKASMYVGWDEATEFESQIAERLIERIERAVNEQRPVELSNN